MHVNDASCDISIKGTTLVYSDRYGILYFYLTTRRVLSVNIRAIDSNIELFQYFANRVIQCYLFYHISYFFRA